MAEIKEEKISEEKVEKAKKIANKNNTVHVYDGVEETILRFFRWISSITDRLFQGKHIAIFALIFAIILYITANYSDSGFATNLSSSKTLNEIKVVARYNSETFEVSGIPTNCDIVLSGDAAMVNNAATKEGYCLLNLEGYTEGTHTVSLTAYGFGDNVNTVVVPSETQIVLKHKTTSQFDIGYDYVNKNSLDSKFILAAPTFADGNDKVSIRASQDTLNSISLVKALIDVSSFVNDLPAKTGNGTDYKYIAELEVPLIAYDGKGRQVEAEIIPETVSLTLEVNSYEKEVPILLNITGELPVGMGLESVSLDQNSTKIYGTVDSLNKTDSVTVNLDLSTVTSASKMLQPINLPSGIRSSEITMVNIDIKLAETTNKILEEVPIVFRNNVNNLGASEVETTTVQITVVGTEAVLENITAEDCVVYIDLRDENEQYLEEGVYDLPIKTEKSSKSEYGSYVQFIPNPNHVKITLVGQE